MFTMNIPNSVTWMLRNILEFRDKILDWQKRWDQVTSQNKFLLHQAQRIPTERYMDTSNLTPKCAFIIWLLMYQRLHTLDRLAKWGLNVDRKCRMCEVQEESHQHLFLDYSFIHEGEGSWKRYMCDYAVVNLDHEIQRVAKRKVRSEMNYEVWTHTKILQNIPRREVDSSCIQTYIIHISS